MKKIKAKKRLGQHFLRDQNVIDKILELIMDNCDKDHPILEVGPGEGILTKSLNDHFSDFKAVEIDKDVIPHLSLFMKPGTIIHDDFLQLPIEEIFPGSFNLVGNFPYNISSQIIFKMLDHVEKVPLMIGMFQKEVAKRICGNPGNKDFGILSLRTQVFYEAELLFEIGPEAFDPPPKVDSAIIMLKRKKDLSMDCEPKTYNMIIKASFQQRRKKLRNTLKPYLNDLDLEILHKRPEQLSVSDFINIAQIIDKQDEKQ